MNHGGWPLKWVIDLSQESKRSNETAFFHLIQLCQFLDSICSFWSCISSFYRFILFLNTIFTKSVKCKQYSLYFDGFPVIFVFLSAIVFFYVIVITFFPWEKFYNSNCNLVFRFSRKLVHITCTRTWMERIH